MLQQSSFQANKPIRISKMFLLIWNRFCFSWISNYELNNFSFSIGYSKIGSSYNNIPFGMIYKWESGQSYLGTDNLLSFLAPSSRQYSGISFGTCFYLFGRRSKYKDQLKYLPFYKEKKERPVNKKGLIFNNYNNLRAVLCLQSFNCKHKGSRIE